MELDIQLTASRIPDFLPAPPAASVGAWVEFRGLVRGEENGQAIAALEYEAYSPMAEREIARIFNEIAARIENGDAVDCGPTAQVLTARVIHRTGVVPVGEAAIYVGIAGRHRAEAFAMLAEFMDRLKQDVPIWKQRALPLGWSAALQSVGTHSTASPLSIGSPATAAEVVSLLRELCAPLETEAVDLAAAAGRVLRDSVCAPEDQPPFDRSSVDGYAVRLDDPSKEFRIVGEIRAGDWSPRELKPGETLRIATGGALPGERLQVVMKEDVAVGQGRVTVARRDTERNIRFRGEDAGASAVLVQSGVVLRPGTIGLLASVGCVRPLVNRLPCVLHLATGNEIIDPAQPLHRGEIRDSNSALVRSFLAQWGITPIQHRVREDAAAIGAALARGSDHEPDLILISGGASVGEHDFTRVILEQAGFEIRVRKTTARPGKPLIVARRGRTLAFGLPGNPLAHFVCLNLYVRVALESWSAQQPPSGFVPGLLGADLPGGGNLRETFWPAQWTVLSQVGPAVPSAPVVTPLRWASSGDLTALATANALIRVPAAAPHSKVGTQSSASPSEQSGSETLACGSRIEFLPTGRMT